MMHHYGRRSSFGPFLAGVAATVVVGGYFLFGSKKANRNRAKVEAWIEDAKDEVLSKVKKVKDLTEEKFDEVVESVSDKYTKLKELGAEKKDELKDELKKRWKEAKEEAEEE